MASTPTEPQPEAPNWNRYSKYREIRLFKAILLTMNIQPTKAARSQAFQIPGVKADYLELSAPIEY